MLIVCPNCATSYMIDPASVGPAGRSVRCARCKSTWFATAKGSTAAPPAVSAFVDGVIAEADAETNAAGAQSQPETPHGKAPPASQAPDDFGGDPAGDLPTQPAPVTAPPVHDNTGQNDDIARRLSEMLGDQQAVPMENAPSLVPPMEHEPLADGHFDIERDAEESESFAIRRQQLKLRRQKSKRNSRWTAVVLVLFAFNVALIGARNEVVRYLPQTASLFSAIGLPVNLRNLKFDKVKITKETTDGVSILVIEGMIVNTANKPTDVPRLRFAARNTTGQDLYTWSLQPERPILGPNESMEFHSRLAAPPADATDVMVRFFTAQDAATRVK